jgi:hypothetical protein
MEAFHLVCLSSLRVHCNAIVGRSLGRKRLECAQSVQSRSAHLLWKPKSQKEQTGEARKMHGPSSTGKVPLEHDFVCGAKVTDVVLWALFTVSVCENWKLFSITYFPTDKTPFFSVFLGLPKCRGSYTPSTYTYILFQKIPKNKGGGLICRGVLSTGKYDIT